MPKKDTVDGIPVELPDDVEAARRAFQGTINAGRIVADASLLARQRLRIVFLPATGTRTLVTVGNRSYPVHPFTQAEGRVYWVGCEMELNPTLDAYEFHSISLVVLLQRTNDDMDPVLRAEWERAPSDPPSPHGQPHWHVYQTAIEHFSRTRFLTYENDEWRSVGDDVFPIEDAEVASAEQQNVARMHFAMAARWHTRATNAHYEAPNADRIAAWVSGCLEYTRSQLTYIVQMLSRDLPF